MNPIPYLPAGTIHATLPDAHCVMHAHTTPTMAVCCLKEGLSFTNFYAAQLYGQVACHDFEGITVHRDEGARILASSGGKPVLPLRNHGPVVIGRTLAQAFNIMWLMQRAREIQVASQPLGELQPITEAALQACVRDSLNFNPRSRQPPDAAGAASAPEGRWDAWGRPGASHGAGEDSFGAMQRLIDRIDPGYRA